MILRISLSLIAALLSGCASPGSYNSVDGRSYTLKAPNFPQTPSTKDNGRPTSLKYILLLSPESAYSVTAQQLADFTKDIHNTVEARTKLSRPSQMVLNIQLYPDQNPTFIVGASGTKDKAEVTAIHDYLSKKYTLRNARGVVRMELHLQNKPR